MSSTEHSTPPAPAEEFDPTRMNAQTARLMASDMAALAGAMFRLLQPQAVAAPAAEPAPPEPAASAAALPVPGLAVPGLDLQPPLPDVPSAEPAPGFAAPALAVPALAVPGLAVPGIQPPRGEPTLADFEWDPEQETGLEDELDEVSESAQEPAPSDAEEPDTDSPRSQALLNEIAFLDD